MAVQIGLPGYPMRPPTQFMQPPPTLPAPTATFALPSSPVIHQPEQTLHHVKPQMLPPSPSRTLQTQSAGGMAPGGLMASGSSYDGRRMRSKTSQRRTVDYNASLVNYIHNRVWQRDHRDQRAMQPDPLYSYLLLPPAMLNDIPINAVTTRSVRTATNKIKCPVFCTCWTPEGRRLVTGASSGEFTLWNGLTFSFETILQAHDSAVRSMIWSHNDHWMLTGDHSGFVKYWQSNMNNVKMYQAHKDPVRGLSFCPTDQKFATCSDDGTVRIWDFFRCHEEKILRGHGADVKCVDWHPHKSLLASGSKDSQQPVKLWDPRTGSQLATIHAHKSTVMDLKWNKNGNWLMTASRDHLLKLFDIRQMKEELQMFRGHKKEATTIAWHPIHECLFASGGSDGAIMFWLTSNDKEIGSIDEAHEGMVWTLSWHPLGHVLVSGSNDHTTKFWTRNRLGDAMRDRYNLNTLPYNVTDELADDMESLVAPAVPGLEVPQQEQGKKLAGAAAISVESEAAAPAIPGLDISDAQTANSGPHGPNVDSASAAAVAAARRKNIYTKPIPKEFERAWAECRPVAGGPGPAEGSQPPVGLLGDMPGDDRPFNRHPEPLLSSHDGPNNWRGPQPLLRSGAPSQQSGPNMGFSAGPRGPGPSDQSRHSGGMPRPLLAPGEMNPPGAVGRGQSRSSGPRPLLPAPSSALHQDDRPPFGWSNAPPGGNSNQFFDEYGGPCDFDDNGMPGNMDMNGPGPMQGPGQRGQGNRGLSGSHQGPVPLLSGPDQLPRPSVGTGQMSGTRLRGPGHLLGPRGSQQAAGPRGPGPEQWQGPGPEHWQRDADSWQHEPGGPMLGPDSEHWQGPGPRGPGQFGPRGPGPNQGPGFHPADEGSDGQFGRWPQRPPDMDGPDHSAPFRAPGSGGPLRPPPSLLDLNVKPPMPKGGGMKRKWEPGGPLLENDDRPPMDIEGPPGQGGPFGHPSDMMGPGPGYMQPDDEMSDLAGGKGFSRVAPTMSRSSRGHRGMRGGRGR